MKRMLTVVAVAILVSLVMVSTAGAVPPVHETVEFQIIVEDQGQACGFPVRWEIVGTLADHLFFNHEGDLIRIVTHVEESNVLTNLATGKSVSDEPVFNQIVNFDEDGSITSVETMGLFVNARNGSEHVMDVGRVIIGRLPDGGRVLLFAAGQHPFREATLLDLQQGLVVFCDILA